MSASCLCGKSHEWTSTDIILQIWMTLGPHALTKFVDIFTDFTTFKITEQEYTRRAREVIPSDYLVLADRLVDALVYEVACQTLESNNDTE